MSEDRLDHFLLAWQEEQRGGRDLSATDLCREQPELAAELQRRIDAVRQMENLAVQEAETLPPPEPFTRTSRASGKPTPEVGSSQGQRPIGDDR
jgi:hypothetical protein